MIKTQKHPLVATQRPKKYLPITRIMHPEDRGYLVAAMSEINPDRGNGEVEHEAYINAVLDQYHNNGGIRSGSPELYVAGVIVGLYGQSIFKLSVAASNIPDGMNALDLEDIIPWENFPFISIEEA